MPSRCASNAGSARAELISSAVSLGVRTIGGISRPASVLHSPTYRTRYAEFLKIDVPRVPLTRAQERFGQLTRYGAELVDLHLLRLPGAGGVGGAGGAALLSEVRSWPTLGAAGLAAPAAGSNAVEQVRYDEAQQRVAINAAQWFSGISRAEWEMQIGGYQPLEKWLKDRKGRTLSYAEIQHYLRMVVALRETRRIMAVIDDVLVLPVT